MTESEAEFARKLDAGYQLDIGGIRYEHLGMTGLEE
jgi:hypothetical protein